MPRARLSAYKSSITNRGPQSGGSVGGNDKAGLVSLWQFSGVTQSVILSPPSWRLLFKIRVPI